MFMLDPRNVVVMKWILASGCDWGWSSVGRVLQSSIAGFSLLLQRHPHCWSLWLLCLPTLCVHTGSWGQSLSWSCIASQFTEQRHVSLHSPCRHHHPRKMEEAQSMDLHSSYRHHHPADSGGRAECKLTPQITS